MRKLFEKGKQFLKKLEEEHDKKRKDSKDGGNNTQNTQLPAISDEERKEQLLSKCLDHEKMVQLSHLLLSSTTLSDESLIQLQQSIYYREQPTFNSINAYMRRTISHQIDFTSPVFLEHLNQISSTKAETPSCPALFFIGVVGFHHKKGSVVEFCHPSTLQFIDPTTHSSILEVLPNYCMPDAIHNKNEDYVYFTLTLPKNKLNATPILYGVSYFKQIKVTEEMRKKNPELTRSHLQKSVFVLSSVPMQGYIMGRLEATTKVFFEQSDINDFSMLECAYENMNQSLSNNSNIQESEIYFGTSVKTLIHFFREKSLTIVKALLLQKKILVFSLHSCATSNFIMSLLSLIPGQSFFRFSSKHIDAISSGLNEYGLPLRLFNESNAPLEMYFTIQSLDSIDKFKGYLIGTTNQLIKSHKKAGADIIIDLDQNTMTIPSETLKHSLKLNSAEKKFMEHIIKNALKTVTEADKDWKNMEYQQNESMFNDNDWIRQQFSDYIINLFCELDHITSKYQDLTQEISAKVERKKASAHKDEMDKLHAKLDKPKKNEKRKEKETRTTTQSTASSRGDEELMNELFDDLNSDDDGDSSSSSSSKRVSNNNAMEFDGGALMGVSSDFDHPSDIESDKQLSLCKESLKASYKTLKTYNMKFLKEFLKTPAYKYWAIHHDQSIRLRSINSTESSEKVSLVLENGEIYVGSMQNGRKTGKGSTFDRISGKIESCSNYENDRKQGHVTISTVKGDYFFEGEYENDKKEGVGNLVTDKLKYSGMFVEDKFHGQGCLVEKDGSVYDGEFYRGAKQGMGKYTSSGTAAAFSYVGSFKDNVFNGQGQMIHTDTKDIYSGDFKNNMKHGQGEFNTNTFSYNGEFMFGKFQGQGMYKNLATQNIYQGEFKEGAIDPLVPCIIKYANGDVYSGEIVNWLPHGNGLISFIDGRVTNGVFRNGEFVDEKKGKEEKQQELQMQESSERSEKDTNQGKEDN